MTNVELSNRAKKDLRRLAKSRSRRQQVVDALLALDAGAENLDVKPLEGRPGWYRLRAGDHRVLYRPVEERLWVERIVNRRDLHRAVSTL